VTATHTVPLVPASLVAPPKSELVNPGLYNVACVINVNSGTMACETVCSVPTTEASATTKQPQETTRSQAEPFSAHSTSTPSTQAKLPEGPTPPSSVPLTTPIATSQPASAPATIVVVKQPQPTKPYNG